MLAGSFGMCFNKDFQSEDDDKVLEILRRNIYSSKFFPEEKKADKSIALSNREKIDSDVYQIVRTDALNLFEIVEEEVENAILEQLLFYQNIAPFVFLQTYEIINYLKHYSRKDISTESLRLIIRNLRFKGIIIVSSHSRSGYKLAVNREDVRQYFSHYSKYILPMLKKVQIANDVFMAKTVGEFNPLTEFEELVKIIDVLKIDKGRYD